jgi:hypothetical protein
LTKAGVQPASQSVSPVAGPGGTVLAEPGDEQVPAGAEAAGKPGLLLTGSLADGPGPENGRTFGCGQAPLPGSDPNVSAPSARAAAWSGMLPLTPACWLAHCLAEAGLTKKFR